MLKFWADVAPSFGMIGTMIGLVGMLKNMDDLKGIGDSFAIAHHHTLGAVVTTLLRSRGQRNSRLFEDGHVDQPVNLEVAYSLNQIRILN